MGFTFGYGAPMGYAAAAGRIDAGWFAIYAAAILWDLGFDTIYAHQDREDDALVGVKSTARLFAGSTRPFLAAVFAADARGARGGRRGDGRLGLVLSSRCSSPAAMFAWQVRAIDIDDPGALPAPLPPPPRDRARRLARDPARPAVTDGGVHPRQHGARATPPLVPEIALHLATEITPIWRATEAWLAEANVDPPFWAFAWPGGQATGAARARQSRAGRGPARARFRRRQRHRRHRLRQGGRDRGGGRNRPARRRRDRRSTRAANAVRGRRRWPRMWSGRIAAGISSCAAMSATRRR